ncbi:MAG: S41 family peptidase [Bacteroidia bacterium]
MVKNILILITSIIGLLSNIYAQENICNCQKDLEYVFTHIQKTPSFKDQFKGKEKDRFEKAYFSIQSSVKESTTVYHCFFLLVTLLESIKDNHIYLRGNTNSFTLKEVNDLSFIENYRKSREFRIIPGISNNLDSLETELANKHLDSIEGIYFYKDYFKIGIFETSKKDSLIGVVLKTSIQSWDPGQVILQLNKKDQSLFQIITGKFIDKSLFHLVDYYTNGKLIQLGWTKDSSGVNYYQKGLSEKTFDLIALNSNTQYLKLGSFNSFGTNLKEADEFYDQIRDQLTSSNMIVDLRGNTGGGDRVSAKFFKLLKKYSATNKIYILINYTTMSNAEQFTVKLKKLDHVLLLGMRTNGTISYGRNKPNTLVLPSKEFKIRLTDLDNSKYMKYEEVGIKPDIELEHHVDWIDQTVQIINKI